MLKTAEIAISMDGRDAWRNNVFLERLWRTIKYEEIHLHAHDSVLGARASIGRYLAFYNAGVHTAALTGKPLTRRTSTSCSQFRPQPNRGGKPLIEAPEPVQRNRAASLIDAARVPNSALGEARRMRSKLL